MKIFTTQTRARYCETDAAEVVYYGSFLHYFEVGKMEMFRELGLPYDRRIPIVETACKYPAPAHFDDLLEIRSRFDSVREKGFKVRCEVYRVEDDGTFTMVGEGFTAHVAKGEDGKAVSLPQKYVDAIEKCGRV